jgi:outer membrane immunogenic protein
VSTDQRTLDPRGGFFGGQVGYNWQFAPQWVAGIEADIQGAGINGSATAAALNPVAGDGNDPNAPVNANAKTKLDWFGTVRGRLGYTFDRTLIYATGGFAFGGVKDTLSVSEVSEGLPLAGAATSNKTLTGFAVGGGWEWMFAPRWSLKGEYQYIDLGSTTLATSAVNTTSFGEGLGQPDCCDAPSGSTKISHTYHTVRLGLNYKFGAY